jgi:hypothetical protein
MAPSRLSSFSGASWTFAADCTVPLLIGPSRPMAWRAGRRAASRRGPVGNGRGAEARQGAIRIFSGRTIPRRHVRRSGTRPCPREHLMRDLVNSRRARSPAQRREIAAGRAGAPVGLPATGGGSQPTRGRWRRGPAPCGHGGKGAFRENGDTHRSAGLRRHGGLHHARSIAVPVERGGDWRTVLPDDATASLGSGLQRKSAMNLFSPRLYVSP